MSYLEGPRCPLQIRDLQGDWFSRRRYCARPSHMHSIYGVESKLLGLGCAGIVLLENGNHLLLGWDHPRTDTRISRPISPYLIFHHFHFQIYQTSNNVPCFPQNVMHVASITVENQVSPSPTVRSQMRIGRPHKCMLRMNQNHVLHTF